VIEGFSEALRIRNRIPKLNESAKAKQTRLNELAGGQPIEGLVTGNADQFRKNFPKGAGWHVPEALRVAWCSSDWLVARKPPNLGLERSPGCGRFRVSIAGAKN
jgi:hypothetical protein